MTCGWDLVDDDLVVYDPEGGEIERRPPEGDGWVWSDDRPDAVDDAILDEVRVAMSGGNMPRALRLLLHVVDDDIQRRDDG
jgi:hypothetical protein